MAWMFISLMSSWLGITSVDGIFSRMPEGDLVMMAYSVSGTMRGYQYYVSVERQENGVIMLKATTENYGEIIEKKVDAPVLEPTENYGEIIEKKVDAPVLEHLRDIIKKYKMYKYKERYLPPFHVTDGYMWNFRAKFSDGESISSHGSNARPRDDGFEVIRAYITEVLTADSR